MNPSKNRLKMLWHNRLLIFVCNSVCNFLREKIVDGGVGINFFLVEDIGVGLSVGALARPAAALHRDPVVDAERFHDGGVCVAKAVDGRIGDPGGGAGAMDVLADGVGVHREQAVIRAARQLADLIHDIRLAVHGALAGGIFRGILEHPVILLIRDDGAADVNQAALDIDAIPAEAEDLRAAHAQPDGEQDRNLAGIAAHGIGELADVLGMDIA